MEHGDHIVKGLSARMSAAKNTSSSHGLYKLSHTSGFLRVSNVIELEMLAYYPSAPGMCPGVVKALTNSQEEPEEPLTASDMDLLTFSPEIGDMSNEGNAPHFAPLLFRCEAAPETLCPKTRGLTERPCAMMRSCRLGCS